jgi:hypothetical protein
LGRLSRVARASISAAITIVGVLFIYGYLKPIGLDPKALLGFDINSLTQSYGDTLGPFAALAPGGATGFILYEVLSRVGHSVSRVADAATMPDAEDMMSRMNIPGMMGMTGGMGRMGAMGMMGAQATIPANLPADITRSQYIILRYYRQGMKSSGDIGKALSMDSEAIDSETSSLTASGYLTKDRKLTTKALEVLGA